MDTQDDDLRIRLEEQDWNLITKRLIWYAQWLAHRKSWHTGHDDLPQGKPPADIACDAIKKVWNEERKWDSRKCPDLLDFLKSVVKSDMNHLVRSWGHEHFVPLDDEQESGFPEPIETPEEKLKLKEEEDRSSNFKNELEKLLKDDEDALLVFICLEEGFTKPKDIALQTGLSEKEVNNAKKRIRRRAQPLRRSILNGENEKKGENDGKFQKGAPGR